MILMFMYDISAWLFNLAFVFLFNGVVVVYRKGLKRSLEGTALKVIIAGLLITLAKMIDTCSPQMKHTLNDNAFIAYAILFTTIVLLGEVAYIAYRIFKPRKARHHHTSPSRTR